MSEIILQQTRIEQGLPYYLRFVEAFPTIKDLANAPEDEVLNLWQGLGYYSRARNMHEAAKMILHKYNGVFPADYKKIRELKGVGDYTAAAVASIAFDLPQAAVDGNVYRVLSRVYKISEPIDTGRGKKVFFELAQELLDTKHPGDHNQALMEIGALVCTPAKPDCENCPLNLQCMSREDKSFLGLPVKKGKVKVRNRVFHYLVIYDGKSCILKKRGEKDIWEGLYDFRLIESDENEKSLLSRIRDLQPVDIHKSVTLNHVLSHQRISATFWEIKVDKLMPLKEEISCDISDLDDFPMPRLLIRYLETARLSRFD